MWKLSISYFKIVAALAPAGPELDVLTFIGTSIVDISDSCSLNNVSDNEFFDRFILWDQTSAIGTVDAYDVSSAMFGTSSISSFLGLSTKWIR
ncbi:hypothetical protein BpHYR1_048068 [Brachionus plicatilis]|uniref:Uncharacterized protein n=1 Tax=Brachionus plicatilis TaxID=10195 RepID=A0A3M7S2M5_BRAPC|nr:hypothetical protein BpHYR1_048068 [Brachionus plicatilis]